MCLHSGLLGPEATAALHPLPLSVSQLLEGRDPVSHLYLQTACPQHVLAPKSATWVKSQFLCLPAKGVVASDITALCLFLHLCNDYKNISPKFRGLQLEPNDLMYEERAQCPVPYWDTVGFVIIMASPGAGRGGANSLIVLDGFVVNCLPLR